MHKVNGVRLKHFNANEFIDQHTGLNWSSKMDHRLLVLLDALRNAWGRPISISNGEGTIGRTTGNSQHNWTINPANQVRAVDIIPSGINTRQDAEAFAHLCFTLGFTGVGFYPNFNQGAGFHVDTRDQTGSKIAKWGRLGDKYVEMQAAMAAMT